MSDFARTGYEARPGGEPERRALLDLQRRVSRIEKSGGASIGGGVSGRWQINSNAGAAPGGTQITSDTGDFQSGLTWVRFAKQDLTNLDFSAVLMAMTAGKIYLGQQTMNADNRAMVEVDGAPTDGGTYIEVPSTVISSTGGGAAWQEATVFLPL